MNLQDVKVETEAEAAARIYAYWKKRLDGECQGACAVIAMNIYMDCNVNRPSIVAGFLTSATGWRCGHFWVESGGETLDPMGDEYSREPGFKREVAYRCTPDKKDLWHHFVDEYHRQKMNIPKAYPAEVRI